MITLYRILFPMLVILALPYYTFRMFKRGGYEFKFKYRAGCWPQLPEKKKGVSRLWIQAVSVGELSSLSKLLGILLDDPKIEVVLSGTTSTGLKMATRKYGNRVLAQGPFPLDWLPFSHKAWKRIDPDAAILVDSEIWPEHFYQATQRGIPIIIINARLSDRTFRRLSSSKMKWSHSLLFPANLSVIAASERQRLRWLKLNFPENRIVVSGNLKIDAVDQSLINSANSVRIREELGFSSETIVLAGVSTWPGEEKLLFELVQSLRLEKVDIKLLIIPRHAERRNEIKKTLDSAGLPFHLRSEQPNSPHDCIAYLADTTGEVMLLLQAADFAFMGKSIPPHAGGQNPIEPVALGLPLVMGPNHQNFVETCSDLLLNGALLVGENKTSTTLHLQRLAQDPELRANMSKNCKLWMDKQGTPSEFTSSYILKKVGTEPY
jgi:3-deoxy-D-manno-octulosonic-acid transferase